MLLTGGLAGPALAQATVPAPYGLAGWYEPFGYVGSTQNPRAVRMIESGPDGTSQGGVSVVDGVVGTAFQFDGPNARVDLPDLGQFDVFSFTIEAWVYFDANANPGRNYILSQGDPFSGTGWALMSNGLGQWHFHLNGSPLFPSPALSLPDEQWVHIAVTFEGGRFRFFQNTPGTAFQGARTATASSVPTPGSGPIMMGNSAAGGQRFAGRIDELAFYDRKLDDDEIKVLFLSGSGGKLKPVPSDPPMACWYFPFFSSITVGSESDHATEMVWHYAGPQGAGSAYGFPDHTISPRPPAGLYSLLLNARNDHQSVWGLGCFYREPFVIVVDPGRWAPASGNLFGRG